MLQQLAVLTFKMLHFFSSFRIFGRVLERFQFYNEKDSITVFFFRSVIHDPNHIRSSKLPSVVYRLSCLPLNPRFAGLNLAEDYGFLRAIKIRSTTFFGGKGKCQPHAAIFRHVKEPCRVWKKYFIGKIQSYFSSSLIWFATRCFAGIFQRALVDKAGMVRTQMGTHNRSGNSGTAWDALYDTTPKLYQ
jgi:hypothetical protein